MTGWTWDYVEDNMTMARLKALEKTWLQNPPTAVSASVLAQGKRIEIKKNDKPLPGSSAALDLAGAINAILPERMNG